MAAGVMAARERVSNRKQGPGGGGEGKEEAVGEHGRDPETIRKE